MPLRLLRHPLGDGYSAPAVFAALHGDDTDVFWLDSGTSGTAYLGAGERWYPPSPVLDAVRAELAGPDPEADAGAPAFRLGLVGWLGYELRGETMGAEVSRVSRYPDAAFLRVTRAVAIEPDGSAELLALGPTWDDHAGWRDEVTQRLRAVHGVADVVAREARAGDSGGPLRVRWHESDAEYLASIAACQDAIREGEAYQLCLTTEARVDGVIDPVATYRRVRELSPSHHGALLRIGGVSLLSASPERFLEVHPDGIVRTHPIKGTRRRDPDAASDARLRDELLASDKERAENIMIVDLMRNDLARVSEPGSVVVPSLLDVESYPQVHQLVSSIEGRLRGGLDGVDAIAACLPAGSMTGAPKRRATEILDRLERRARGLYAGAFGYLGRDGRIDLAMTIRSIVIDEHGATLGTGGGITALSVPEEELAEARLKAAALLGALGVATLE
ncbi:MAG TPA: anthranilate synthase component I family protein [Pseudolysinimonas sp.]|jgi:anthranilate synthase component 1|nr:anthranilate synthase component I family protein [Pseudolysinimonas sp.]